MSEEQKPNKASVSFLPNNEQCSPRVTLEASLAESDDWEELVMVYRKKGDSFHMVYQRFAGDVDYPQIQWLLGQALNMNSLDCIRLQSIIDDQEGL